MRNSTGAPGYRGSLAFLVTMVVLELIVSGVFLVKAPDRVPSHFDMAGQADDWSSKTGTLAVLLPLGVLLPALMGIRWPWGKWPALLNVPYKNQWIASGRRKGLSDRVVVFMRLLGGLVGALMSTILLVMLLDARADTPGQSMPSWVFPSVTGLFLIGVGLCIWKSFRDLRPDW